MVILDPCGRLNTIFNQIVPTILVNAAMADKGSLIDDNLVKLETQSFKLADRCMKDKPQCETACQYCDADHISEFFRQTWDKLEEIREKRKSMMARSDQDSTPLLEISAV